jgi:hypothetical protein
MTISIHQPNYIPWLGYFFKIFQSDTFVFLDDVQYSNEGMHNFHYIKTPQGALRLKIPVEQHLGDLIAEVKTKDKLDWKFKHLKSIEANYKKAAHYHVVMPDYERLLLTPYLSLAELNIELIKFFSHRMGFATNFVCSSQLGISTVREEKVLDICTALNADVYYSGIGARVYQKESDFAERHIELMYSVFKPFEYEQLWGDFHANVSVLDYVMNCGYDWQQVLDHQCK